MKRAVLIFVAALLVLLIYPSTHPLAASSRDGTTGGPVVITPESPDIPPIDLVGDNDDGDADGVAGIKGNKTNPTGSAGIQVDRTRFGPCFKMWWKFLIWIR